MHCTQKITMRREMSLPLKALPDIPYRHSVHSAAENPEASAEAWSWIINHSVWADDGMHEWAPLELEQYLAGEPCEKERVFLSMMHSQEMGTASVLIRRDGAYVGMLGVHPYGRGRGLGKLALNAALEYIRDHGYEFAGAEVRADQIAAIGLLKDMGFEPVMDSPQTEACWKEVEKNMSEYVKTEKERIILWPEGNIPYFREENCIPAMTAYPIEGSKGAVVVCPGGGYTGKAAHEGGPIAEMLNEAGISAYVLDYRVKPCHYNAPVSDAHRAIRTLRHMGYEKVGILGFSAGGHLTCSAATLYDLGNPEAQDPIERHSCRPDAFIPCYAVVSFISFRHQGSVNSLLGDEKENWELIYRFSAEMHVDKNTPPAFIWHTAEDAGVPVENSLHLARAMAHAGVPYELHIFPNGGHGLGLAQNNPAAKEWGGLCQKWLLGLGFGKN